MRSPVGATAVPGGVNFSVFSRGASSVEFLLFDRGDDIRPTRVVPIDPAANRTHHYWHAFVPNLQPGQLYGYRVQVVRRSQHDNKNAYCQDNETGWFNWTLVTKHADVHRFVTMLRARRLLRDGVPERQRLSLNQILGKANKAWHGVKLGQPDWSDSSHGLAFTAEVPSENLLFHLILNAYWEALDFELPQTRNRSKNSWCRWVDTSLDAPHDIVECQTAPSVSGPIYRAGPRSVVLFALMGPEAAL
jgi:pullulanase/glycogen debranching enzyme